MTTEVSLGIATFCFGMGIGALLTRFQWNCVKHRVTQELEGKLRGILLLERRHSVFDPPNATIRIILPDNDSPSTIPPSPVPRIERRSETEPSIKSFPEATGFRHGLWLARTNHWVERRFPDSDPDANRKHTN
jgi:hypothetical protein